MPTVERRWHYCNLDAGRRAQSRGPRGARALWRLGVSHGLLSLGPGKLPVHYGRTTGVRTQAFLELGPVPTPGTTMPCKSGGYGTQMTRRRPRHQATRRAACRLWLQRNHPDPAGTSIPPGLHHNLPCRGDAGPCPRLPWQVVLPGPVPLLAVGAGP